MAHELKPIRTEADYHAAMAEIEGLWGAKSGTAKGDRLDVLATLVEAYEVKQYPLDPIEAIRAEVLNHQRSLSIKMIRRLHDGLSISADILIQPSLPEQAAV